ncbi:Carbonyl reductase [Penaeus vannamei]|uniref:carbonyl reductase (NADPH) n=1 Tax=Penaeus vannamei TaxID=6689 RepID=A0A3R7PVB2_PENVA|nr:carbonyl reductase [NADPH] 1-like [Penaeus vannamei]ROT78111.1 Carbonyl reductase [Penaeus vannamei]
MEETRVAVVTGSNKGIGLAIVKDLCSQFEGCVYLTARDEEKGLETVAALEEEGLSVRFHQLDIDDEESIAAFKTHLEETYGGLDVLVNNAAIAYKGSATEPFGEQAENTIRVNFFGTLAVCRSLFPLLRPHARVVTLSSFVGFLPRVNGDEPQAFSLREKLSSEELTEDELSDLMNQFVETAKDGTWTEAGWQSSAYSVSKVGVTALTRVQQRAFDEDPREDLIVNCCNPGAVVTDMSSQRGVFTAEQGAECPVYLALLPPDVEEPKGAFVWHDKQVVDWVKGPLPGPY